MPEGRRVRSRSVWYESQKEHWVGWLYHYNSPGAYSRKVVSGRDAKFVYNHVVCPGLLLYLAQEAGVDPKLVRAARRAVSVRSTLMGQAGEIRRIIPWSVVFEALQYSGYLSSNAA